MERNEIEQRADEICDAFDRIAFNGMNRILEFIRREQHETISEEE